MFNFNSKKKKPKHKKSDSKDEELAINAFLNDQVVPIDDESEASEPDVAEDEEDGIIGSILDGNNPSEEEDKPDEDEAIEEPEEEVQSINNSSTSGDIEFHGIEHIDKLADDATKKNKSKKILFIAFGGVFVILLLLIAAMFILTPKETEKPDVTPTPSVAPVEDEFIDGNSDTITPLTQYGEVKRILKDKIIIRPDNSLSDTIYFLSDKTEEKNTNSLDIGKRLEYTYGIVDSKNIFISHKDIYTGTVISVGENHVILLSDTDEVVELRFPNALIDTFNQITADDIIEYSLSEEDLIESVSNILKPNAPTVNGKPEFADKSTTQIETPEFNPADWSAEYEQISNQTPSDVNKFEVESDFENNAVKFYNKFEGPIWIRFAWKINEFVSAVPSVDQVNVSLITPSGATISYNNIDEYGRMWVDGNIINYAIESAETGEWELKADKNIGFHLGQSNFMLMGLTGFIRVDKFGINNKGDGQLEFIWSIGGVEDPNYAIKIEIVSDKFTTTLYTATSKTDDIQLIDNTIVNAKSIPKGTYDVKVTVQDLDIYTSEDNAEVAEHVRMVGAETIIQQYNAGQLIIN